MKRGAESQPGPMEYNVDKAKKGNFNFSMGAKLGSAILGDKKLAVPGPGNYEHDPTGVQDKAPQYKFGTGSRP